MAAHIPSPTPAQDDLVTLKAVTALLRKSPYPVSHSTLKRLIAYYRIPRKRIGTADYVHFSDVLVAQRRWAERARRKS
ncbi:hypothetical protein ACWY4P_53510 (plasmid) [Streptomyces sp. LZ34]